MKRMERIAGRVPGAIMIGVAALALSGCEFGPKITTQNGYRGTGLNQVFTPQRLAAQPVPAPPYPTPDESGPTAGESYQNVRVLRNISAERFNHLMAAMTEWVAPQGDNPNTTGCGYCHNVNNLASDEKYTKVVARRMLQMTININQNWQSHVKGTGVTCYTCHRGNAVPRYVWSMADAAGAMKIEGNRHGQNTPSATVAYASLPYDPFTPYLERARPIRVQGQTPLPPGHPGASIQRTEATYGLMMHMSSSLGVNCTFCHNSRSWADWSQSTPQRVTAWYGIRMARQINDSYISSLASVFPAYRKGPQGDVYKANCQTCHQGLYKPLGGVSMVADYPDLRAVKLAPVAAAPAPAAAPAAAGAPAAAPTEAATAAPAAPAAAAPAAPARR